VAKVDRLETLVMRELTQIIRTEVKDDLGFITITGVRVTNELSFMYVYYTVLGKSEEKVRVAEALARAHGFLKNQIALRVKMRKVPELVFRYDESYEKGMKIDDLIRKAQ
jgi:ribosome-binding factor A